MTQSKTLGWYRATGLKWLEVRCLACTNVTGMPLRNTALWPDDMTLDTAKAKLICSQCGTKNPEVIVATRIDGPVPFPKKRD